MHIVYIPAVEPRGVYLSSINPNLNDSNPGDCLQVQLCALFHHNLKPINKGGIERNAYYLMKTLVFL